jgi:3-methyladenine DNA glycosylase AlkD
MSPIKEIEQALCPFRDDKRAKESAHIMNTRLGYWGIPVPVQRGVCARGYSFSHLPHDQQMKLWDKVWMGSKNFEVMCQAMFYLEKHINELGLSDFDYLKRWVVRVENWEHADRFAKVMAMFYEKYPKQLFPELKKWNRSTNLWQRRLSVVSLFFYASLRGKHPSWSVVRGMVLPLIKDKEPYVQKGVGWTLREAGSVYPKEVWKFLVEHARELSAVTFSYATEKISEKDRASMKRLRRSK